MPCVRLLAWPIMGNVHADPPAQQMPVVGKAGVPKIDLAQCGSAGRKYISHYHVPIKSDGFLFSTSGVRRLHLIYQGDTI